MTISIASDYGTIYEPITRRRQRNRVNESYHIIACTTCMNMLFPIVTMYYHIDILNRNKCLCGNDLSLIGMINLTDTPDQIVGAVYDADHKEVNHMTAIPIDAPFYNTILDKLNPIIQLPEIKIFDFITKMNI